MDTHLLGPRGGPSMGAVVTAQGVRVAGTDNPSAGHDICKTVGASAKNPLWVRVSGTASTLNGTSPVAKIIMAELDGSSPVDLATIAAPNKTVMITRDMLIEFVFTPGAGTNAGEIGYLIEVVGKGVLRSP